MSNATATDHLCQVDRARQYVAAGWNMTPVQARGKNPLRPGWQRERLSMVELETILTLSPDLNLGVVLGESSGGLVDVDLDCTEALAVAADFLPGTAAVFGRASKPRSHWLYIASLKTKQFKDPVRAKSRHEGESAMLVEIRSTGAQTVMPGSTHGSGESIEWDAGDGESAPQPASIDPATLARRVGLLAATALLGRYYPPQGVRHEFELALAGGLLRADVAADDVIKVINGIAKAHGIPVDGTASANVASTVAKIAAGEAVTGWPTVVRALGEHGPAIVAALSEWLGIDATQTRLDRSIFVAYLPTHKYINRLTGEVWESAGVNASVGPIRVGTGDDGQPTYQRASTWLDTHQPVHQMTWAPGQPEVIEDRLMLEGGTVESAGQRMYNRYRAPLPMHGDASQAGPWLDHLKRLYPEDWRHIAYWLAQRVQQPGVKLNHALVLGGSPGIGKDTLLEPVMHAVGPWNVGDVSPSVIVEKFNRYLRSVLLRVSEARDLGEVNRYSFYEHMKTIIAAPPDTLRVDEKFLPDYYIPNVVGVVFTTNHRTNGLYLPPDDRRHYVAWSEAKLEDFEPGYFDALYRWYQRGGFGHVRAYLATLDLSGFDPKAPPAKTEAFWAMVNASRGPEESELDDALDALGTQADGAIVRPKAVTVAMLSDKAQSLGLFDVYDALTDRRKRRRLPHVLQTAHYIPVRNPSANDGLWVIKGKRQVIYAQESLPRGEQIAAAEALVSEAR